MPTREQIEEEIAWDEARYKVRAENIMKARATIVADCGGPWKKGMPSTRGQIDCPVCGGDMTLAYSRAGYNGHVHAHCVAGKCVSWME